MKIIATSRAGIRTLTEHSFLIKENFAVISITNPFTQDAIIKNSDNLMGLLRLNFDDIEKDEIRNHVKYKTISNEQAKEIVDFVNSVKDKVDLLIVHCEAGVSRSVGVAAAVSLILNGSEEEFFTRPSYYPNMKCYRTVLEAFGVSNAPMSQEEFEKCAQNS